MGEIVDGQSRRYLVPSLATILIAQVELGFKGLLFLYSIAVLRKQGFASTRFNSSSDGL